MKYRVAGCKCLILQEFSLNQTPHSIHVKNSEPSKNYWKEKRSIALGVKISHFARRMAVQTMGTLFACTASPMVAKGATSVACKYTVLSGASI